MTVTFRNMLSMLSLDMSQRIQDMDVLSNNLANVNTTAFKSSRTNFQELLGHTEKSGSLIGTNQILTTQGPTVNSGRLLDLYIAGDGYLQVKIPTGETAYTRDSRLLLTEDRQLVNSSGYPIIWEGEIPEGIVESDLLITESGEVGKKIEETVVATQMVFDENGNQIEKPITYMKKDEFGNEVETELTKKTTSFEKFGTISLARFANPSALTAFGSNLYLASENSGAPEIGNADNTNFGKIQPGMYEGSNVNMGDELTHLISIQRGMQLSARSYKGIDLMIDQAIQMPRI